MRPNFSKNNFRVGLGLGSNLGDGAVHLAQALGLIETRGVARILKTSSLWRTPPWGYLDQPPFANACALLETHLPPYELLAALKTIEADMGRRPGARWGPRIIDLDILFFDGLILKDADLTLPHKDMLSRVFVLAPLAEIAPNLIISGQSIARVLQTLDTTGLTIERHGDLWLQQPGTSAAASGGKTEAATISMTVQEIRQWAK